MNAASSSKLDTQSRPTKQSQPLTRSSKPSYGQQQGSADLTLLTTTRTRSWMSPKWIDLGAEVLRGVQEKQPSSTQLHFTAMDYQWTSPKWTLKPYQRYVLAARRRYGTLQSRAPKGIKSSPGSDIWGGAGEMEGDCKPIKWLKELLKSSSCLIRIREEQHSRPQAF